MKTKPASTFAQLLRKNYPTVYRLAVALCGDRAAADRVARQVLRRSGSMLRTWESDEEAGRWFARFTVLNTRNCAPAHSKADALLEASGQPELMALVRAVRQLPMQQREAFLLHHGQKMGVRQMATAMDCSAQAASTHLAAAAKALGALSPTGLARFAAELPGMLDRLAPPPTEVEVQIGRVLRKRRWKVIARYGIVWPIVLAILMLAGIEGWRIWKMIVI